jgi:hypothetical protein
MRQGFFFPSSGQPVTRRAVFEPYRFKTTVENPALSVPTVMVAHGEDSFQQEAGALRD